MAHATYLVVFGLEENSRWAILAVCSNNATRFNGSKFFASTFAAVLTQFCDENIRNQEFETKILKEIQDASRSWVLVKQPWGNATSTDHLEARALGTKLSSTGWKWQVDAWDGRLHQRHRGPEIARIPEGSVTSNSAQITSRASDQALVTKPQTSRASQLPPTKNP